MTKRVRAVLMLIVALAMMGLASCDHYNCNSGATFGNSSCSASGSGLGTGTGSTVTAAFAYAVDQGGTLDGYTLNTVAGTFAATSGYIAPTVPTNSPGTGMVIAQKQFVYAVFGLEQEIFGWSIDATTGSLTALTGFPMALSLNTPNVVYNEYNIATNPAGTLLFISNTGANEILVYQISTAGALTAAGSPVQTSVEPGNLATDGLGKYLYVTESVSGHAGLEILAYSIGTGGALAPVSGSPFPYAMWQVQGDSSGAYLIGTTGKTVTFDGSDDDHLYVFSINSGTGAISQVGTPFGTTYSPFNIAVQPSTGGEAVYSFSINDTDTAYNPVEGFELNTSSGAFTTITGSPFTNVATGHWGQFDQSGALLFVYSSVVSGSTTTTQLGVLSVGSGGVLTQAVSPVDLVTPGYWAVTDPQ
jgi:6-phosphogluconolactonase (cycloisomerase 2 family)